MDRRLFAKTATYALLATTLLPAGVALGQEWRG